MTASGYPLLILCVGLTIVVGGIIVARVHAFLALITAAIVVSLMAPGALGEKIPRVAEAFGAMAAGVGIVIALAAIIGMAMTASGAADRIVRMFARLFGPERGAMALTASGFTLAIPVFFDTVFFLLIPLVRSMHRRTGGHYVKYLIAAASCAAAHALVPPTPGPLLVASTLNVDLGTMMVAGFAVALPAVMVSMLFAGWIDRRMTVTPPAAAIPANAPRADDMRALPGLGWSVAPIVLPVALITSGSVLNVVGAGGAAVQPGLLRQLLLVLGNPNVALLLSAVVALITYWRHCRPGLDALSDGIGEALMAAGVIVLITCAGGAFGAALKAANVAGAIQLLAGDFATRGFGLLLLAFAVAALIKFAQGSSTAAMIVTSAMLASMLDATNLGFHPVYIATAIGSGSLVGSWMNDSGFWIFARMGGLTEIETLKTWTPLLALLGGVSMIMTLLLAIVLPMT